MSGEKPGVREKIDRYAKHLVDTGGGKLKPERAKQIARRAARYVEHGEKYRRDD